MSDKSLQDKAINIKGKDYIQVKDRILYFNETFPNGSIETKLLSEPQAQGVVVQAVVIPDVEHPGRLFTGLAQEVVGQGNINQTSALENAETSAVGRALAMMGIGIIESVASADEVVKATKPAPKPPANDLKSKKERIHTLMKSLGYDVYTADDIEKETGLAPEPKNYEGIIKGLSSKETNN